VPLNLVSYNFILSPRYYAELPSYLDAGAADDFLLVVKRLQAKGQTIILATHNLEPVAHLADEIAVLSEGKLLLAGMPEDVLYSNEIKEMLGRPLFVEAGDRLVRESRLRKLPLCWNDLIRSLPAEGNACTSSNNLSRVPEQSEAVIEVCGVSFTYPNGHEGVREVSLTVRRGEILGIVGSNGSGKTTLAKLILGLLKISEGSVTVLGKKNKLSDVASKVGYVTQNPSEMLFETTVYKECSFGPRSLGKSESQAKDRVEGILTEFGLWKYAKKDPRSLSGGEQRLLTFADVLVNDPEILILDEPEFGLVDSA
jgi:energy-coupling factor transport system ATP-binding protein